MTVKSEKATLRETCRLHLRALGDMRRWCPGLFAAIALHSLVSALSPYVTVYLSARILNELAGQRRPEVLRTLVLTTLLSAAALTLLTGILLRWKNTVEEKYRIRKSGIFTNKMMSMDFADVDKTETTDLLSQIRQNENWNGWGLWRLIPRFTELTGSVFSILGAVALTVSLFTLPVRTDGPLKVLNHPAFAAALVLILLAAAGIGSLCKNRAAFYWADSAEEARLGNRLFGAFGFLSMEANRAADFRMYNQQVICRHYMTQDTTFGKNGTIAKKARGPMGAFSALGSGISAVLTGIVYVFVCLKAWAGAFGVGSVTQYVGAVTALTRSISELMELVGDLRSNTPFLRTVYEFLDIPNAMYQGSLTTEKRSDRQYEVEFRDVSFRYPGSDLWALRHVNMKFKVGSRLAIVGENGSGKTTFIKLLCRLYDPQEGQILLNGIDIRKYRYDDYRNIFSVVFQDFQLICQPLGANVAGSMEYDRDRAEKALIDAGFGDRLATMEQGLDTMLYKDLSDDGVDVSGGEAQKIAIARALYKNAPFLILDEPTAALDPVAEAEIYSKFNDIAGDKTAVYISHRLSSCKFCDEIAVFHQGAVIQQGTHEELLADESGKYHALWNAQAQYYTEKTAS